MATAIFSLIEKAHTLLPHAPSAVPSFAPATTACDTKKHFIQSFQKTYNAYGLIHTDQYKAILDLDLIFKKLVKLPLWQSFFMSINVNLLLFYFITTATPNQLLIRVGTMHTSLDLSRI